MKRTERVFALVRVEFRRPYPRPGRPPTRYGIVPLEIGTLRPSDARRITEAEITEIFYASDLYLRRRMRLIKVLGVYALKPAAFREGKSAWLRQERHKPRRKRGRR